MSSTPSCARPSLARQRVARPRDADRREDERARRRVGRCFSGGRAPRGHAFGAGDASLDARNETHAAVDMRRREWSRARSSRAMTNHERRNTSRHQYHRRVAASPRTRDSDPLFNARSVSVVGNTAFLVLSSRICASSSARCATRLARASDREVFSARSGATATRANSSRRRAVSARSRSSRSRFARICSARSSFALRAPRARAWRPRARAPPV